VIPARKKWGQHFLVHPETARRIVDAARVGPGDTVIEVGPGEGALTRPLVESAARLLAIEIDPPRAELLARELVRVEDEGDRVRVLQGDALSRSFSEWLAEAGWSSFAPAVLVANLPYNVATPILSAAIAEPAAIARSVATIQKEVAQRFAAKPGSEHYGYLSVRTAAFARARVLFDLPPGAFRPRPKVTSSVLELSPRESPLDPELRDRLLSIASLAFRSRRKTAANALASEGGRVRWEVALEQAGLDPRARAETLSLEDYARLAGT
jgi:16S rRNA (adenine1518-N6/adenine1519-N6)-dimethyltransferase